MIFAEEKLLTALDDFLLLAQENGAAVYGESYDLDTSIILKLYEAGILRIYTARTNDRELVGFAVFTISPKLHERSILCADCMTIYVKPAYRGLTATKLVQFAGRQLKALGACQIQYHAPERHTNFFSRQGYFPTELTFRKDL